MTNPNKRWYKITFIDDVLATTPGSEDVYRKHIRTKMKEDAKKEGIELTDEHLDDEASLYDFDERERQGMTIFPRNEEGAPVIWAYQFKGNFKEACGMLKKADGSLSAGLRAHKKEIDGLVFIEGEDPMNPDQIVIDTHGEELGRCERPLRASTPQGERVSLACSESAPKGSTAVLAIKCYKSDLWPLIEEWLDYGADKGLMQWRNSGKGRFVWQEIDPKTGEVIERK